MKNILIDIFGIFGILLIITLISSWALSGPRDHTQAAEECTLEYGEGIGGTPEVICN